jgi:hypothetical protein
LTTSEPYLVCVDVSLISSAHVNVAVDASEKNDGWVSIAGKAKSVLLPLTSGIAYN